MIGKSRRFLASSLWCANGGLSISLQDRGARYAGRLPPTLSRACCASRGSVCPEHKEALPSYLPKGAARCRGKRDDGNRGALPEAPIATVAHLQTPRGIDTSEGETDGAAQSTSRPELPLTTGHDACFTSEGNFGVPLSHSHPPVPSTPLPDQRTAAVRQCPPLTVGALFPLVQDDDSRLRKKTRSRTSPATTRSATSFDAYRKDRREGGEVPSPSQSLARPSHSKFAGWHKGK